MDALTMFVTENLRMPEEINRSELNDPRIASRTVRRGFGLPNRAWYCATGLGCMKF
jgi:hypothetical protein